jgi:hypothetical protein
MEPPKGIVSVIKKRMSIIPRPLRTLFLLQAIVFFGAGVGLLLMPDFDAAASDFSGVEHLLKPIFLGLMLAFATGLLLATRSRTWREVQLLIQIMIAFCVITLFALAGMVFTHGATIALWVSILITVGNGSAWSGIYLKHSKEVRGPGINIKEF